LPTSTGSSPRRTVSTSGSSGMSDPFRYRSAEEVRCAATIA
jgi:hypothetical protein